MLLATRECSKSGVIVRDSILATHYSPSYSLLAILSPCPDSLFALRATVCHRLRTLGYCPARSTIRGCDTERAVSLRYHRSVHSALECRGVCTKLILSLC